MKKDYIYTLQKGSKHIVCPACGHKTFKPYVDKKNGQVVNGERFGRCERINNCNYHERPRGRQTYESRIYTPKIVVPKVPDFINPELVRATFSNFDKNVFFRFLVDFFGAEKATKLQIMYNIGTAKGGGTIFWQQDKEGRFRTGKVMYYNANGKRDKQRSSWYVHKLVKADFELKQVFFGEHLTVGNDLPISLCESEKTAIMMTGINDFDRIWIASGGAMMLSLDRLIRLGRLEYVYPDNGETERWTQQTAIYKNRHVDDKVDRAVRDGRLSKGADIFDLYQLEKQ